MRWKFYGAIVLLVTLGIAMLYTVRPTGGRPAELETVRLADAHQIASALLYIADAENYFTDAGLAVVLTPHSSGNAAFATLLDDKADIATVAEAPFMRAVLEKRPVQAFVSIQTTDKDFAITARTDAGIKAPEDLAGKRIGTIPGTGGEAFLDLFLTVYGLNRSGVVVMPFTPDEAAAALVVGSIDAVSAWTTVRLKAQEKLPAAPSPSSATACTPRSGPWQLRSNSCAPGPTCTLQAAAGAAESRTLCHRKPLASGRHCCTPA